MKSIPTAVFGYGKSLNAHFVDSTIHLINQFLNMPLSTEGFPSERFAREHASLELKLPRGSGSTFLCHLLAVHCNALIIVFGYDQLRQFEQEHQEHSEWKNKDPRCLSIFDLNANKLVNWNELDIQKLIQISEWVRTSPVIAFDMFSKYADNKAVSKLLGDCGLTHRFIMFR